MAALAEIALSPSILVYLILIYVISNAVSFVLNTLRPRAFPPGPKPALGVGNLLQLDRAFPFLTFGSWSKKYGVDTPLGIKRGAANVVVLNSGRLVHELFEKRGAVYADRPWIYMNTWVFQHDLRPALFYNSSAYHTRWRREFNNNFGPTVITRLRPVFEAEAARLLVKLIESPGARGQQFEDMLVCWMISVSSLGVCGRRPDYMDDHGFSIKHFTSCNEAYAALLAPSAKDLLPFLRYLPSFLGMSEWKKKALTVRNGVIAVGDQFLSAAKEQRAALDEGKPIAWESVLARMLREKREKGETMFTERDMGNAAFHIVATSTSAPIAYFQTLLMTLVKFPEVQKKIRDEALTVSGGGVPMATDIPQMKYLEAVWNEVHRWRPVAPQAVPHVPTQDDVYNGYQIPKGTTVIMNAWQIHHNEDDYENPDKFDPDRYLRHPLGMRTDKAHDPAVMEAWGARPHYDFGAGRRICPGMYLAKQNFLLGLAKMLWAFEIRSADNKEIDLSVETGLVQGTALHPKDFDLTLKLRQGRTKEDIMNHYYQTYEGEAEIMGWKNGEFR
ncbi:cytochrome P450 [Xylaria bambusicola]|uniref:cytochrome P450 n=1 Tax=Xylaria bambusicola TaxID=326684 RepID=UPI002007E049|nr:cytochrome P450 [Xylaria bambusicola]KAI0506253.1 cytochrome P450 [Xylaria bambusicola]